jgi:hypothetical protein
MQADLLAGHCGTGDLANEGVNGCAYSFLGLTQLFCNASDQVLFGDLL